MKKISGVTTTSKDPIEEAYDNGEHLISRTKAVSLGTCLSVLSFHSLPLPVWNVTRSGMLAQTDWYQANSCVF